LAPPSSPALSSAGDDRLLSTEELGFSLALPGAGVPRDLDELDELVEKLGGRPEIDLRPSPKPLAARALLESVAGAPPARPDESWSSITRSPVRLRVRRPTPETLERLAEAEGHLRAGRYPEARAAFRAAARLEGDALPEPAAAIGDTYAWQGRWTEARGIYETVVRRFPWSARARARLGNADWHLERRSDAASELGRALALHPNDDTVRAWLSADRSTELVPSVLPPAQRAAGEEQVWILRPRSGSAGDEVFLAHEAVAYASCKEAFRQSPELRRAVSGREFARWTWSPGEESVCAALWVRAYVTNRARGRAADPELDSLWETAAAGALVERALFDVGAPVFPSLPAFLDEGARARLFAFVARFRVTRREGVGWFGP
jgi:tetratricopeptide (TPR) repeat protein